MLLFGTWLHALQDPQIFGGLTNLRNSMAGGSSWLGHGTAMGPERCALEELLWANDCMHI